MTTAPTIDWHAKPPTSVADFNPRYRVASYWYFLSRPFSIAAYHHWDPFPGLVVCHDTTGRYPYPLAVSYEAMRTRDQAMIFFTCLRQAFDTYDPGPCNRLATGPDRPADQTEVTPPTVHQ